MSRMGVVWQIAAYVEAARSNVVTEPVRQTACKCIFDLLAAVVAGLHEAAPTAVRRLLPNAMGTGAVPIWFAGQSSSVIGAAWANSAAAAALDLDDGNRMARGHPGAAVIPTALAVAHETGASLDDVLCAIVIGYEVGVTIASARTAYGSTGTWAPYAVAATAAALRRTSRDVLAHALAIAGESAPNQSFASLPAPRAPAPEGSDVKEGLAWSVLTGLFALELAQAGHTGPRNILDSPSLYNFPDELFLGSDPRILSTYFKLYACCRHVHAPLDALQQLIGRHGIDPRSIDSIEVETYSGALRIANKVEPLNTIDVQYSIPYCLALLAFSGSQALLPITSAALRHDAVVALAKKVTLALNPEFDAVFPAQTLARLAVTCAERRYVSEVTSPKGEASSPLSWQEIEQKFRTATRIAASELQRDRIVGAMDQLRAGNLSSLIRCFSQMALASSSP